MKNIFHKIKSRTFAIGFLTIFGTYYVGKKFYDYLHNYGEVEAITDEEIRDTLGIGAGDEYTSQ